MSIRKPHPANGKAQDIPPIRIVVEFDPQKGVSVRHPADPLLVVQLLAEATKAVAANAARATNQQVKPFSSPLLPPS